MNFNHHEITDLPEGIQHLIYKFLRPKLEFDKVFCLSDSGFYNNWTLKVCRFCGDPLLWIKTTVFRIPYPGYKRIHIELLHCHWNSDASPHNGSSYSYDEMHGGWIRRTIDSQ